ncbi:MAG: BACON domain-containing carbohydrate-binding protein [Bryobacteraceae bacterium]
MDGLGNVYIADSDNNAIEEWSAATQQLTPLVSTGLSRPEGVAVDSSGNVYIADSGNNAIEEWSAATQVTPLVSSGLSDPLGVAVDGSGNVYIADTGHDFIREWSASLQELITVLPAGLSFPSGVAVDVAENVYVADTFDQAIKEWGNTLVPSGLDSPFGVAVDGSGNVYIAHTGNLAIKEIPFAFVGPASMAEPASTGSDSLLPVLPATASLAGIFAPTSDQPWLSIGTIANGVIDFSFMANTFTSARAAHITVLGQQIAVTQNGLTTQTITFGALPNQPLGTAPFTVGASASSGLAVSFASTTSGVCTLSDTTVTLVAVGTCTIQATQAGNTSYAAATPVSQSFQVTPGPTISSLSPAWAEAGGPAFTLTVNGANFLSGAVVQWNGTALSSTFVSATQLTASITPDLIASAGTANVTVLNPGGATSAAAIFTINPAGCTYAFPNGTTVAIPAAAGQYSIQINAGLSSCAWNAGSDQSWLTLSNGNSSGSGTLNYTVAANNAGVDLTAHITVAGQPITVTQDFTSAQFADIPPSATFFDAANLMFQANVTTGCQQSSDPATRLYCPDDNVTRQEMAAFIVRAVTGTTNPAIYNTTPYFNDVPSSNPFFPHIQKLMDLGITTGCSQNPPRFCPTDTIPRWEMAIFMIRARLTLYGAAFIFTAEPYFSDVPTNVESNGMPFPFIQRSFEEHIANGCGGTLYCPDEVVTRGQMASFIMRGLFNQTMVIGPTAPYLTGASPNTVAASMGSQVTVTITGVNTSFQSGDTVTVPSGMLAVSNVVVNSATSISATLTVNTTAVAGPQALVVTTGGQNLTLPLAIKVGTYGRERSSKSTPVGGVISCYRKLSSSTAGARDSRPCPGRPPPRRAPPGPCRAAHSAVSLAPLLRLS